MLSLGSHWATKVAVNTLRCHLYLIITVGFRPLNDGRQAL